MRNRVAQLGLTSARRQKKVIEDWCQGLNRYHSVLAGFEYDSQSRV